jgi:DDE superfamily endonuclease
MREFADVHFPKAQRIRVVPDNLSTHFPGSLYQAFPPCEARRVLEFHHVPKHASWLNMVEIEIGVLRSQCLDGRIAIQEQLVSEIAAWEQQRNASGARIKWMFTTERARVKNASCLSGAHFHSQAPGQRAAVTIPFKILSPFASNQLPSGLRRLKLSSLATLVM